MSKKSRTNRQALRSAQTRLNLIKQDTLLDLLIHDIVAARKEVSEFTSDIYANFKDEPDLINRLTNLYDDPDYKYCQALTLFSGRISNSVAVEVNGISHVSNSHCKIDDFSELAEWGFDSVMPPFPNMFLDFGKVSIPNIDNKSTDVFLGVHLTYDESSFEKHGDASIDMFMYFSEDKCEWYTATVLVYIDEHGKIIPGQDFSDWLMSDTRLTLTFLALLALQFLNCNNVQMMDREADTRPFTRNAETQRNWLVKYKTAVIKPMSKHYKSTKEPKEYQGIIPLHLRRGGWMRFTEYKPAWGKPWGVGTFWRPATAVGESKNGTVIKDYKVIASDPQIT